MKYIYIVLLFGVACYSAVGFLHTFEPNGLKTRILFWGIYSTTFIGSILGIIRLLRGKK